MKSVISLPSSCECPRGPPRRCWLHLLSLFGGGYLSRLVLPCWSPSPSLALTRISMLGSRCRLKTLKPENGSWEGREGPKAFLSPTTTSASLPAGSDSRCVSSPGIYVIGFSYPVVPKGKARIRVQISAVHSDEDIDRCVEAFTEVGRKHGALP